MSNNSVTPKFAIYLDFNLHELTPSANMKQSIQNNISFTENFFLSGILNPQPFQEPW